MLLLRIKLREIRIGLAAYHRSASHRRWVGIGVVEQYPVAHLHRPHEIAGLVVAHAVPVRGLVRLSRQAMDGIRLRLRFHQPEICRTRHSMNRSSGLLKVWMLYR